MATGCVPQDSDSDREIQPEHTNIDKIREKKENDRTWTSPTVPSKNTGLERIDVTHGQIQHHMKPGRYGWQSIRCHEYIGGKFFPNVTHFIAEIITQEIEIQMGCKEQLLWKRTRWLADQLGQYTNGSCNSDYRSTASQKGVGRMRRTHRAGGSSNDIHDLDVMKMDTGASHAPISYKICETT